MGSTVDTPATYNCVCDLCGHVSDASPSAVPEGWGQVYGPSVRPSIPKRVLLCTDCFTQYKTFWKIES